MFRVCSGPPRPAGFDDLRRFFQQMAQRRAPLLVPVADEHLAAGQRSLIGGRPRAADLAHEGVVRMRRTADDLHSDVARSITCGTIFASHTLNCRHDNG